MLGRKSPIIKVRIIQEDVGFMQVGYNAVLQYLEMSLFQGRTVSSHFNKPVKKVKDIIDGWSNKLLMVGEKWF